MPPEPANVFLATMDADADDERRYKLLAATTDEEDDRVIVLPEEHDGCPAPDFSRSG